MPGPVRDHYMITNCRNAVVARFLQRSKLEDNQPGNTKQKHFLCATNQMDRVKINKAQNSYKKCLSNRHWSYPSSVCS